jgi:sodium/proline symporter
MVTGTVVLVVWKQVGLSDTMYEIVPGFVTNCATILVLNRVIGQNDRKVLRQYEEVVKAMTTAR